MVVHACVGKMPPHLPSPSAVLDQQVKGKGLNPKVLREARYSAIEKYLTPRLENANVVLV